MRPWRSVVALSGGVGGARLVDGLAAVLPPEALTVIVNTGDDFVHWGLSVSPDADTIMYTLAGLAHPEQGWGLEGETFQALAAVERLGGPAWFRLGDRDLGTHLVRTQALAAGRSLTAVTADLCRALGVGPRLLPMSDAPRPTILETDEGTLGFQEWLVGRRGKPVVRRVWSEGASAPAPGLLAAIAEAEVVVIGPSNPYVSIDPILALDGVRAAIAARPVVAVSPIVHGAAVKGPLAGMIRTLAGREPDAAAIAGHYGTGGDLLDGLIVERGDVPQPPIEGLRIAGTATVMHGRPERIQLARETLAFAAAIAGLEEAA